MIHVGRVEDVPLLEGRSVAVGDRRIAVFRTAQGFHALDDACPHRGGPLADGLVADSCVTCPLHGWRFELSGGAALGAHPGVTAHEVLERDGELWVRLAAAVQAA